MTEILHGSDSFVTTLTSPVIITMTQVSVSEQMSTCMCTLDLNSLAATEKTLMSHACPAARPYIVCSG